MARRCARARVSSRAPPRRFGWRRLGVGTDEVSSSNDHAPQKAPRAASRKWRFASNHGGTPVAYQKYDAHPRAKTDVLALPVLGCADHVIATTLAGAERTIEVHVASPFEKAGRENRR